MTVDDLLYWEALTIILIYSGISILLMTWWLYYVKVVFIINDGGWRLFWLLLASIDVTAKYYSSIS